MAQPKYEIIKRIGTGGMAEVFKASSTSVEGFQKLVAIKRVLPSLTENERFVRMFLDEAKIALPLSHTNIVQTFDLGMADETYFIVMEYVECATLKDVVNMLQKEGSRLGVAEACYVALEILKGLDYAHSKTDADGESLNIVHRDISPPNILLSRSGEVKITDFGLAKAKSQAELTDPGVVKGKFGYLSPEAAHGEDIDGRTDIFAVGILLWEMLTGQRLFLGESDYETLELVREADIPPVASRGRRIPESLQDILDGALAKHPDDRYRTARQLGEHLAQFLYARGEPVTSFQLRPYVRAVLGEQQPEAAEAEQLGPADKAVQREINEFVSIDDLQDMDRRLARAEPIGDDTGSSPEPPESGDYEDPRAWSDIGFDEELEAEDQSPIPEQVEQSGDEWKEQELSDVARATSSMPAIDGPDDEGAEPETTSGQSRGDSPKIRGRGGNERPAADSTEGGAAARPSDPPRQVDGGDPARQGGDQSRQEGDGNISTNLLTYAVVVLVVLTLALGIGIFYLLQAG
jgi:serine/threonine-protein kinase